ncbi:protein NinD [Salmonella enterica subsp. enterica serovar Braenderup]
MESEVWRRRMKHCYRCGESKEDYRFRPNQPSNETLQK